MPGIKTILAVVGSVTEGRAPLETAFAAARTLGCHVEVLHVRPDPTSAVPLVGEAMSGAMVDEMMAAAEREGRERAAKVRQLYEEVCGAQAVPLCQEPPGPPEMSASWREEVGSEDEVVALRGRVADLIVIARPQPDTDSGTLITLNAALMESGHPVMAAPPHPPGGFGKNVAIAWNGSAEAARAVTASISFLALAERVTVLVAEESERTVPTNEIVTHLGWHGISAEVRHLVPDGGAGAALLKGVGDCHADLLVMGAYTHSRLRQLILGGVTRHILEHAAVPVLLSH